MLHIINSKQHDHNEYWSINDVEKNYISLSKGYYLIKVMHMRLFSDFYNLFQCRYTNSYIFGIILIGTEINNYNKHVITTIIMAFDICLARVL